MTEPEGRTFANVPTEVLAAMRRRAWIEAARSFADARRAIPGPSRDLLFRSAEDADAFYYAVDRAHRARLARGES